MVYFNETQKTFEIDGFSIGGQPGENPTFLFGGIRKINPQNKEELKQELEIQKTLSRELKLPSSVDLFIREEGHVQERIDFIAENISEPFLIDLPFKQIELKKAVLEYIDKRKLQERIIYNSINFATSEEELDLLKNYGIKSAILLAVDIANPGTNGSLNLLEKKLLSFAERAGIKNTLVDPGTMGFDNDNIAGEVLNSIMVIKSETGLPAGCAMINLAESWEYFKNKKEEAGYISAVSSLNSLAQMAGADFLIYGPTRIAGNIFPSAAMTNKICTESNRRNFGMELK
jgi:tetrahydromethanopterin S-methyltransferase subunit H